jgi:hypothetical protein
MWHWNFFWMILSADCLSETCFEVAKANKAEDRSALPDWWWDESGLGLIVSAIIAFLNMPLFWANLGLNIAAFFWIPWLAVLITSALCPNCCFCTVPSRSVPLRFFGIADAAKNLWQGSKTRRRWSGIW